MRTFIDYGVSLAVFTLLLMVSIRVFDNEVTVFLAGSVSIMLSLMASDVALLIYDRKEVTEFHGEEKE